MNEYLLSISDEDPEDFETYDEAYERWVADQAERAWDEKVTRDTEAFWANYDAMIEAQERQQFWKTTVSRQVNTHRPHAGGRLAPFDRNEGQMAAKHFRQFEVNSDVALIDYSRDCAVHYGKVVSVTFAPNGYPITVCHFPTYGGGIEREYAVEMLMQPEDVEAAVTQHKAGLQSLKPRRTVMMEEGNTHPTAITEHPGGGVSIHRNKGMLFDKFAQIAAEVEAEQSKPLTTDVDDQTITLGAQEPPQDPMIYNRQRPDGSYPPLSGFFNPKREDAGE